MILGEQKRPEGCITDLKFDAWFAGEISGEARAAVDLHVAACGRCQHRQAALAVEREAFLATSLRAKLPWRTVSTRRKQWVLAAGLTTVMISAAAVIALYPRPRATEVEQAVRLKGGAHIGFFVQREGKSERGVPVYIVHPRDQIRFVYTSSRPAYLAIYGLDARGTASVYFPSSDLAERRAAGSDVAVNSALELDDVLGAETVFALFCEAEFKTVEPKKRLAAKQTLEPAPGCRVDTLTWNKVRAP